MNWPFGDNFNFLHFLHSEEFAGIFLIINGIVAGYNKRDITNNDMIDAALWPISVSILFGLITRLLTEKYADYKITKSKTKGKKWKIDC